MHDIEYPILHIAWIINNLSVQGHLASSIKSRPQYHSACSLYLCVKSSAPLAPRGRQVVLLLRNPYRALVHARGVEAGHRDDLPPSRLVRGTRWHQFVRLQLQQWLFEVQLTLGISERVHVVHYEELQVGLVELHVT